MNAFCTKYYMSKKLWPILYSNLLHKMGHYFSDTQYIKWVTTSWTYSTDGSIVYERRATATSWLKRFSHICVYICLRAARLMPQYRGHRVYCVQLITVRLLCTLRLLDTQYCVKWVICYFFTHSMKCGHYFLDIQYSIVVVSIYFAYIHLYAKYTVTLQWFTVRNILCDLCIGASV